jgi:hypothetical protein
LDAVFGVAGGIVEDFADLACIVRFAPSGVVDARDGSSYRAANTFTYVPNTRYRVRMLVNVASKRYTATITPDGGSSVVIADNYAFRTEQSQLSEISNFAFVLVGSGEMSVQDVSTGSEVIVRPSPPTGLRILGQ